MNSKIAIKILIGLFIYLNLTANFALGEKFLQQIQDKSIISDNLDEINKFIQTLRSGTPQEKSQCLQHLKDHPKIQMIPYIIESILDDSRLPRQLDTGWGSVAHQAATLLNTIATNYDNLALKERGYDKYSFHNDGGVPSQKRREIVYKNWLIWWQLNKQAMKLDSKDRNFHD